MKIGTCDCCNTPDVELSRSEMAGMETWSCTDGCPSPDQLAKIMDGVHGHNEHQIIGCQCRYCVNALFRKERKLDAI